MELEKLCAFFYNMLF